MALLKIKTRYLIFVICCTGLPKRSEVYKVKATQPFEYLENVKLRLQYVMEITFKGD